MSSIIYYIKAVCFTALAHPSSTRHRSTVTCGMPMNNIWRSNRTHIYYKYIGIMIYIDRSRSRSVLFFVLLSKLIQKYKQRNYRYYYFAMHRLLSRQAEISTCIIDLPVHTSLLRLQYYTCIVLYFIAVVLWRYGSAKVGHRVPYFLHSRKVSACIFDIMKVNYNNIIIILSNKSCAKIAPKRLLKTK